MIIIICTRTLCTLAGLDEYFICAMHDSLWISLKKKTFFFRPMAYNHSGKGNNEL